MASYYSNLKIELIGTGDQEGTWGNTTNTNLGTAVEEAITGSVDVAFTSADVTLTLTNTNGSQSARNLRLNLTGTSGGSRNLVLGSGCQIEKFYIINNGLADAVIVKNTTGTGVTVPAGRTMFVFNNGTNVVDALNYLSGTIVSSTITGGSINNTPIGATTTSTGAFSTLAATSLTLSTALAIAQGGTGQTTAANAINALVPSQTGNSGKALVTNGTTVSWGAAFVTGMIMIWSGSIATIPSGWVICDGNNSTPDLRDKFIIGAGSTYAVAATGGSANAIVVSHFHTATSSVVDSGHAHDIQNLGSAQAGPDNGGAPVSAGTGWSTGRTPSPTVTATTGITVGTTVATTGSSGTNANLPPYYALAYIMKT